MKKVMKKTLTWAIDSIALPLCLHIKERLPGDNVFTELNRRTIVECADYVCANMQRALNFGSKTGLLDHALNKIEVDGLFAEFGVFEGWSINYIARKRPNNIIYGFDSFEGLQEDWAGHDCTKGTFDMGGKLPNVVSNVRLIKGWFDKTIPSFISEHTSPFAFIHCDCDTYEASKVVFDLVGHRIKKGTIIVFDEYFGYRGWKLGEFRAWQECVTASGIKYQYLGFTALQVSVRVL